MLSKVMKSRYDQNDGVLILYNTTHSKHEQDIELKEKCEETYQHLNASNHISYKKPVFNDIEGNNASKEQEHASADNTSLTKCLYCQTMFPYSLVELHAQTCVGNAANETAENIEENLKRCQHCQSIFPDSLLEQHTQTCSRRKNYQCSECNKMFRIRSKLLIHQQSHSDDRLHSCNICVKTFKFKSGLTRHMRQQHSGRETTNIQTTLCEELQGLEYSSLHNDINDWEDSDQDENNIKEGKNFKQQHFEKQKITAVRQKVECGLLLNNVNQETSTDHGNIHEEYKENNNVTDRLKQGQENSSYLQKGNDQDNFKEKVHSKSRIRNIKEVSREDTHTFEIEGKYLKLKNTEECKERDGEVNEGCQEPNGVFNECCPDVTPPINMQSYGDSKMYKCQECPKIFAKPSRLAIHSRTHSDERLFSCEICQQTFKYKGSLNRHVKEQHYGQGRKSLGIDERLKNEPKNCSNVGKIEFRNDMYMMNIDESKDGVFRHWKERHYSQGRIIMNERNELENKTFLEKSNFENDGECLVSLKKNLEDTDGEEGSLSKIVDERNHFCLEINEFQNDDQNLMKKYEDLENKETCGKSLDEGQNVNFRQVGKTVALLDESSIEKDYVENNAKVVQQEHNMIFDGKQDEESKSVYNTDEEHARDDTVSMVFGRGQEREQSLSSQHESIFENIDNSTESDTIDTETCKYGESDFKLQETSEQMKSERNERNLDEDSFELGEGEDSSDEGENIFEVISRPSEGLNECFTNSLVNTPKKNKFLECNVCQKFIKRSTWWNHMLTHNDDMSFTCEFCWKYFKYKGSLFRHIKEQHYGLRRRGLKVALHKSLDNNISCSAQEANDLDKEIKSFEPISNEIITSRSMICHKMSKNDNKRAECSYQKRVNNYRAILKESDNRDSNVKEGSLDSSMIFDKRPGNNSPKKVNFELSMKMRKKHLNTKHCDSDDAHSSDMITLTEENVCIQENDNENESSLQEVQQEERTVAIKQYQFDECHNNFDEFQLSCKICGKCFRHKGSRTRHVKEQHYGLGRKSLKTVPDENQEKVGCLSSYDEESFSFVSMNEVKQEGSYSKDTNVNPSVKSVREETFDFEMKESYEKKHSEKDNFMKESSFKNVVDEDGQEDHFYDEQTNDASVMKEGFEKENDDLNKNSRSFKQDLQVTSQEKEKKSASKQDSFNAYGDKLKCDFCGKCYKHQPSLCRHVKEQHYGVKRKSSRMLSSQRQNNVNSETNDRNVNQSVNFVKSEENIDVREETCDVEQSDFEMKKSDQNEHSGQGNFTKESCCSENFLNEVDQQDNSVDEETNDTATVKECFEQENNYFNTNVRSFEDDLQETDQDEQTLSNKQHSFNAHSDKLTCDFCGKCYKHQPSLCRHVKEQHYGLKRKNSKMLSSQRQNNVNSEAISNDRNVNRSLSFIRSEENIDVKEEPFEVKQSDFEVKKSDENEHSGQDNFTKKSCCSENILDEVDRQDNSVDEETNDTVTVKKGFEQENNDLNTNGRNFEDDMQETDQDEQTLASKQHSFNDHSDKLTCDFCGKCYKHQPSLCRHVKEQHYGLKRKSSRMLSSKRQNNVNSCSLQKHGHLADRFSNPEAILNNRNVNPSVNFTTRQGSIDVREETFDVKQNDFEMKDSDENIHSEKDNDIKETSFENVLDEVDEEERTSGSQQDNFDDEPTYDATMVKQGFEQENDNLNKNGHNFEHDLQETDQEVQKLESTQSSFNAHDEKFEKSRRLEITCDFCGMYFKHQPSLCRHVKEQHYGLKRKSSRMLSSQRENNVNSFSSQKQGHLADGLNNPEEILNDTNLREKSCEAKLIFDERQVSENGCLSREKDNLQNRLKETVKEVDEDYEDEKIKHEQNYIVPTKEYDFEQRFQEMDLEKRVLETKHDHVDICESAEVNISEGNELFREADVFTCQECPKIFQSRTALRKHKRVHSDEMSFACEFCQQTFKYKGSWNRHVKEQHYGLGRKSFRKMSDERIARNNECSTVGKVNLGSLMDVFYEDTNFTEETCEQYNFEERRMDNNHDGSDVATMSEEDNFSLQQHVNTKKKNFAHDCHEKAKSKIEQEQSSCEMTNQSLKIKKIHRCVQCPRTFWNSSDLREHSYKHTDVKSFACKLCGKAFKFRSGLVRHNRKEHKGNGLTNNVSENNLGIHGFGEETLQHGTFGNDLGNKDYSEFREGYERIKPKKRKFSGGENDFKTGVEERSRIEKCCLNSESEDNSDFDEDIGASERRKFGGGDECFKTIVNENSTIQGRSFSVNEEISTQSLRQNLLIKKKPSIYKCNKCDATFSDLCDFLAHQRIHK